MPAVVTAFILAIPFLISDSYILHLIILLLLAITTGLAWNIIGGYAGQLSLGHAAFYGIGAYTATLLFQKAHLQPWWGLFPSVGLGVVTAAVIGAICFRLRGPYFALATIASAEIIRLVAINWKSLTYGAEGILIDPGPVIHLADGRTVELVTRLPYYYTIVIMAALALAITRWIDRARLGYFLRAIREDQDAAEALGINTLTYKLIALAISAAITAAAGSFSTFYTSHVEPDTVFNLEVSVQMVLVCIIGGMGTVYGPVLGATVLVLLSELLRNVFVSAHLLVYGVLVVVVILFMPDGVLGWVKKQYSP